MKTILVAYDDSDQSRRALDRAASIAEKFGSKVLVTSIAPLLHSGPKSAQYIYHGSTDPEVDVNHAHATLEQRGIDAETVTAIGDPASAIAKLAAEREVDLVVVGTRELGTMRRLLGQSVSQAVSRRVHCDVSDRAPGPPGRRRVRLTGHAGARSSGDHADSIGSRLRVSRLAPPALCAASRRSTSTVRPQ